MSIITLLQTQVADSLKTVAVTLAEQVKENPTGVLSSLGQQALHFGVKVVAAILLYIIGMWLIGKLKKLLTKVFLRRNTEKTIATFAISLVSIVLTVLLIIITVGTLGVDTSSFAVLLGAGGMAIGMALSGTVQNFAGGVMILLFKPFKAGDFITAQGYSGTVSEVTITSTKIVTPDNREVVIPNGILSNGNIDNYSKKTVRRIDWSVSVEYGTDSQKCIADMVEILNADPRTIKDGSQGTAAPVAMLTEMSDSSIRITGRAWVNAADYWDATFAVNNALYTELPKRGHSFAYPHVDVSLKQ